MRCRFLTPSATSTQNLPNFLDLHIELVSQPRLQHPRVLDFCLVWVSLLIRVPSTGSKKPLLSKISPRCTSTWITTSLVLVLVSQPWGSYFSILHRRIWVVPLVELLRSVANVLNFLGIIDVRIGFIAIGRPSAKRGHYGDVDQAQIWSWIRDGWYYPAYVCGRRRGTSPRGRNCQS